MEPLHPSEVLGVAVVVRFEGGMRRAAEDILPRPNSSFPVPLSVDVAENVACAARGSNGEIEGRGCSRSTSARAEAEETRRPDDVPGRDSPIPVPG